MRLGSWRGKPSDDFIAIIVLTLGIAPPAVTASLSLNGYDPLSTIDFAVTTAYRRVIPNYAPDLTQRLDAKTQETINRAIRTDTGDVVLPGGLVYLTEDGLELQRVTPAQASLYAQENRAVQERIHAVCGGDDLSSCDVRLLYAITQDPGLSAAVRERAGRTLETYEGITGEIAPGVPMRNGDEKRLTLREMVEGKSPYYLETRASIEKLLRPFVIPQPHEQRYTDELRAYASRPAGDLYGTWEYRNGKFLDWPAAREAGNRKPHLIILQDRRGTLVWQFYKDEERGFLIAPDGTVKEYRLASQQPF